MADTGKTSDGAIVQAAFGSTNRNRLIDAYFASQAPVTFETAWKHVYRLLLWADQTTGLAHCYESDKSQPGKNWYARSLAFHDFVASALAVGPAAVADEIDWLFRQATKDLASAVLSRAGRLALAASKQRQPYDGRGFPEPGDHPELVTIINEVLGEHFFTKPSPEQWRLLVQRIRQSLAVENKRKNLVGEGFEDVLGAVIRRSPGTSKADLRTRSLLQSLPGFDGAGKGEKPSKVDLAIIRPADRTIVTAKWSLRADREKQFVSEYTDYLKAETTRKPWKYVFVTNEFDPARLMRACEILGGHQFLFAHVVHISTRALAATYGEAKEPSMKRVLDHIKSGRLIDLGKWLELLAAN